MGKEVKNSLGEILKDKEYVYWYVISNMGYELRHTDNVMSYNYGKPYLFLHSNKTNPRGMTAFSLSKVGAALLIEELKELMRKEYGEKAIDF